MTIFNSPIAPERSSNGDVLLVSGLLCGLTPDQNWLHGLQLFFCANFVVGKRSAEEDFQRSIESVVAVAGEPQPLDAPRTVIIADWALRGRRSQGRVKMRVEEEYADVLQNIESAIVAVFDKDPNVVDRDVLAAVDALMRSYMRDRTGRGKPTAGPPGRARAVYQQCRRICEWRLGRQPLNEDEPGQDSARLGELSVSEIILCLKRLRKSVRLWHSEGGRQGYLRYVRRFFDDAASQSGV